MGFSLGRAGADGVLFRDVDVDADSLLEHLTHAARLVIVDNTIVHFAQHLELQHLDVRMRMRFPTFPSEKCR